MHGYNDAAGASGRLLSLFCFLLLLKAPILAGEQVETQVSVKPFILTVRNFLSPAEQRQLLDLLDSCHRREMPACKELRSGLHSDATNTTAGRTLLNAASKKKLPKRNSTSYQLELDGEMHPATDDVVRRAHLLARHPITHGEGVQVASYYPGEYYEFHHDSLRRRATVLIYLNEVAEGDGGETIFPLVKAHGVGADEPAPLPPAVEGIDRGELLGFKVERFEEMQPYCDSNYYLKIRPEAGMAVLFYSYGPDNAMDRYTIHGACPVKRGYKAVWQRWMRFDPNSLYNASTNEAVRRERVLLGTERLLQPGTTTQAPPSPLEL